MKRLSLLLFLLAFSYNSFGQGLDLGIKFGANYATLADASGLDNKTGFHFGAFAAIKFSSKVALQGELLYSQQGAKLIDLDYVNAPILIKYYLIRGFNVQLGPQFGFLVDDNIEGTKAETMDVSAVMGLGLDLPFGLRLDGRYNLGLTDVAKNGNGKNSVFSLAVGYSFL